VDDSRFVREFSKGMVSILQIYSILDKARVPHYLQNKLLATIGDEIVWNGFHPFVLELKRKALKKKCGRFKTAEPILNVVALETKYQQTDDESRRGLRDEVEVIMFKFEEQLQDLLADHNLFGDLGNLVVNIGDEDKWLPYNNTTGTMFEVFDGLWYQKYAKIMVKDPATEFCLTVALYVDTSETVTYQRYSFVPLIMSTPLLSNKCCNRKTPSRVIALLPDLDANLVR
jgi:hypothetical protein